MVYDLEGSRVDDVDCTVDGVRYVDSLGQVGQRIFDLTGHRRGVYILLGILLAGWLLGGIFFLCGLLLLELWLFIGGLLLLYRLAVKLAEQPVPVVEQAILKRRVHQEKSSNQQRNTEDKDHAPSPPLPGCLRLRLPGGPPQGLLVPLGAFEVEFLADAIPFRPVAFFFL